MGGLRGRDPMGSTSQDIAALRSQCDEQAQRLEKLFGTLTFLRTSRKREALLAGSSGGGGSADGSADERSPSDLIALGLQVQAESAEAVSRMTRMVESSKQVGSATLSTLATHHTRLETMRTSVGAQEWQFAQAERELSEYAQQVLGDNVTLGLVIAILLALVTAIVYRMTMGDVDDGGGGLPPGVWATEVYSALDQRLQ